MWTQLWRFVRNKSPMRGWAGERDAGSELFEHLDAPANRIGAMDTFVACQPVLEDAILPQPDTVLRAITELHSY